MKNVKTLYILFGLITTVDLHWQVCLLTRVISLKTEFPVMTTRGCMANCMLHPLKLSSKSVISTYVMNN